MDFNAKLLRVLGALPIKLGGFAMAGLKLYISTNDYFHIKCNHRSSKELAIKSFTSDFYLGKSTWNTLTSFCFVP